jgi:glycine/D-amino acid oxidase-like deaminating enzyme
MTTGNAAIFTEDFKTTPYWWDSAPRPQSLSAQPPAKADVVIVGSGITGLSAALTLARAGRDVVIAEAGEPGFGASSRATGALGRTLKHGFSEILEQQGEATARRVYGEARAAYEFIVALIEREKIDCDMVQPGRYMAANTPGHYEVMARDLEAKHRYLGDPYTMVSRADQQREIGSDFFHGGGVVPDQRLVNPGKLNLGFLTRVGEAGARLVAGNPVTGIRRDASEFEVATTAGRIRARDVLVATNGYTGAATPWYQRRLVPIDAFMVATELLPEETLRQLLPTGRTFHEYKITCDYGRPATNQPRLIFGGLTGLTARNLRKRAAQLHQRMRRIFPQLAGVRLSHIWTGRCAASFDLYPHIGQHDGVHHVAGYSFGSGLPLGAYLGNKVALRILGQPGAQSAFDGFSFDSRFFYHGNPWFMPLVMRYYSWADRRGF